MNTPHHGEDENPPEDTDAASEYDRFGRVAFDGHYRAYNARTRAYLGVKKFRKGQRFGCWPSPRCCDVLWIGPVTLRRDDRSEEPGRVADDAAVAD